NFSISVARWPAAPRLEIAHVNFPGLDFAYAINSRIPFAGSAGCATTSSGPAATCDTGVKAFTGSYGPFATPRALNQWLGAVERGVGGGGGARPSFPPPITPFAPARLSMMKFWLSCSESLMPVSRATASTAPPGGYGTIRRTGRVG